jgi:hypothetical protein
VINLLRCNRYERLAAGVFVVSVVTAVILRVDVLLIQRLVVQSVWSESLGAMKDMLANAHRVGMEMKWARYMESVAGLALLGIWYGGRRAALPPGYRAGLFLVASLVVGGVAVELLCQGLSLLKETGQSECYAWVTQTYPWLSGPSLFDPTPVPWTHAAAQSVFTTLCGVVSCGALRALLHIAPRSSRNENLVRKGSVKTF